MGFCEVEVASSPKFQAQEVIVDAPFEEMSVKFIASGTNPAVWSVPKSAVGAIGVESTVMYDPLSSLSSPPSSACTESTTVKFPGIVYVWLGLTAVDVAPSPKSQRRESIGALPAVEASRNWTRSGATPRSGMPAKVAVGGIGGRPTVM